MGVKDRVVVGDKAHVYEDCLVVTCNDKIGEGSIEKIEHHPIAEEREKLKVFLDSVGVEL